MRADVVVLLTLALVVGVPGTSHAQWTLAGYLGEAWTAAGTMTIDASAGTSVRLTDVEYESRSWQAPWYWGVRAGRAFSPDRRWSVELELIHLKVYASPDQVVRVEGTVDGRLVDDRRAFGSIVERFQISHGLNFILINLGFEQRLPQRLAVVARAGLGPTVPHVEATIGGASRDDYTWGRIGMQASLGVNLALTRRVFVTGEVKRTHTRQRLAVGSATTNGAFTATHVVGGIGVRLPR